MGDDVGPGTVIACTSGRGPMVRGGWGSNGEQVGEWGGATVGGASGVDTPDVPPMGRGRFAVDAVQHSIPPAARCGTLSGMPGLKSCIIVLQPAAARCRVIAYCMMSSILSPSQSRTNCAHPTLARRPNSCARMSTSNGSCVMFYSSRVLNFPCIIRWNYGGGCKALSVRRCLDAVGN